MPKYLGTLPTWPTNLAWARGTQPERIADMRTLIKDDLDEDLNKFFEPEARQERCCGSDCLQHAFGSIGLWNSQSP